MKYNYNSDDNVIFTPQRYFCRLCIDSSDTLTPVLIIFKTRGAKGLYRSPEFQLQTYIQLKKCYL